MTIYALGDLKPDLAETSYVAPGARVIGNVTLADKATVWFNAVLRGDNEPIVIGPGSNVQDGCVFHVDPGFPLTLGVNVTVGHSAVLHGCTVGDGSLIGMGAMVLNGAKIGKGCLIGAKALITEGKEIPDYSMVLGAPGKIVKTLDAQTVERLEKTAFGYQERLVRYRAELQALTSEE